MWLNRRPDVVIGGEDPYLLRWYIIPRNKWLNIYLHKFMRSDDDRALHDHPWNWVSIMLSGAYWEHTPQGRFLRKAFSVRTGRATGLHRIELMRNPDNHYRQELPVWTLFITGRNRRTWGFQCPTRWVPWTAFLDQRHSTKGPGCG